MEFQHNHKFEKSIVIFFPKVGKLLEKQYNKANKIQQWEIIRRLQDKIWEIIVLVVTPY